MAARKLSKLDGLDLGSFVLRARALSLFRDALRTARQAPAGARVELQREVRAAMDAGRGAQGKDATKFLLSEGKKRLKELTDMLGLAVVGGPTAAASVAKPSGVGGGCGSHKH